MVSPSTRAASVAAGLLADHLIGEPPARLHPVARFGFAMDDLERRMHADRRRRGAAYAAAGVSGAAGAGALLSTVLRKWPWQTVTVATYVTVAGRALREAAAAVAAPLDAGDLDAARAALPSLVGRDPSNLDEKGIARAVVESLAENTVDAVVAPALWAAAGGVPAAFVYRAVNTLDAMVGHRSARHRNFGFASARLDDAAGWIPARVTAALVAAVRPRSTSAVWRAVRDQAPAHPSPNAGVAEAAFAAALGVTLGGDNVYDGRVDARPVLGYGPPAVAGDIPRASRLARDVTAGLAATLALPAAVQTMGGRNG